ncbi:hypothetical protein FHS95_002160 [Sphingomonas naasensis]|nr:hypothetical protein [Sphingomonas naasensis]NIJ20468.1 hypothetical protein [Sphingomonas naasensis]
MEDALDLDMIGEDALEDNVFAMAQLAIALADIRSRAELRIFAKANERWIERAQIAIGARYTPALERPGIDGV